MYSRPKRTFINRVTIVNEGRSFLGSVLLEGDRIASVWTSGEAVPSDYDEAIDGAGAYLLPGIIDTHVHFREPGLTHKACIATESRAAAAGGVTTFFDMPNTVPQTTSVEAWTDKMQTASRDSLINYAFFFGATKANIPLLPTLDTCRVPGVKLFMGSSTGDMLVDRRCELQAIFRSSPLPLVVHCEDPEIIRFNTEAFQQRYGTDPAVRFHPQIRSNEACYRSSARAVELAKESGARLHIAHLSTQEELALFSSETPNITAEACLPHLVFTDADYDQLGARIKCNPAIKSHADREALRAALTDGRIFTVATDHAPHLLDEKQGGAVRAASGIPAIQFSLVAMLELVEQGVLPIERVAELMCHNPARLFSIAERGFIRTGYKADLTLIRRGEAWTVTTDDVLSRCGWSPFEGQTFAWRVEKTFCNGHLLFDGKTIHDDARRGEAVSFCRAL